MSHGLFQGGKLSVGQRLTWVDLSPFKTFKVQQGVWLGSGQSMSMGIDTHEGDICGKANEKDSDCTCTF